jgi:hypothetical protein
MPSLGGYIWFLPPFFSLLPNMLPWFQKPCIWVIKRIPSSQTLSRLDHIFLYASWRHHGYQNRVWSEEKLDGWSMFSGQICLGRCEM